MQQSSGGHGRVPARNRADIQQLLDVHGLVRDQRVVLRGGEPDVLPLPSVFAGLLLELPWRDRLHGVWARELPGRLRGDGLPGVRRGGRGRAGVSLVHPVHSRHRSVAQQQHVRPVLGRDVLSGGLHGVPAMPGQQLLGPAVWLLHRVPSQLPVRRWFQPGGVPVPARLLQLLLCKTTFHPPAQPRTDERPSQVNLFCGTCSPGYYTATASAAQCSTCGYGRYASQSAATACETCATGSYQPLLAGSTCSACSPGSTSPAAGAQYCSACPSPSYCPGGAQVVPCPLGTFSNLTGLASAAQCPICPANFFCLAPDDLEACPTYTYSVQGTTTKLDCLCDPGFVCTYHKAVRVKVTMPITQAQYEIIQTQLIQAVATAAGVPTGQVSVISVTPQASRRLLARESLVVHLHADGAHTVANLDHHMRSRGVHGTHEWHTSHSIHPRPSSGLRSRI